MIPFRWQTGQGMINLWKEISEGQLYMSGEDWLEGVIRKVSEAMDFYVLIMVMAISVNMFIKTHQFVHIQSVHCNVCKVYFNEKNIEWIALSVLSVTFLAYVILYTEPPLMYEPMYPKPLQASEISRQ